MKIVQLYNWLLHSRKTKKQVHSYVNLIKQVITITMISVVTTTERSPPPQCLAVFSAVFLGAVSSLPLLRAATVI